MVKRLRLAVFVTGTYPTVPERPFAYAPMDIATTICRGLIERGHHVDYFAPEGSRVEANLITLGMRPLEAIEDGHAVPRYTGADLNAQWLWDYCYLEEMYRRARQGRYDLLHIHPIARALPLSRTMGVPTAFTLHDRLRPWLAEALRRFTSPDQHLITISDAQRRGGAGLRFAATIPNGIDTRHFHFSARPEPDTLLFVGRICPDKGAKEAVEVALATGHRLLIAGPVAPADQSYFQAHIAPHLNPRIVYVGMLRRDELPAYYGRAKALLVPLQWDEPFGLNMAEALSCGTPVVALRRGSAEEVVHHGRTGFVVDTVAQMADAVRHIDTINRWACRRTAESAFDEQLMIDRYQEIFLKLADDRSRRPRRTASTRRVLAASVSSASATDSQPLM